MLFIFFNEELFHGAFCVNPAYNAVLSEPAGKTSAAAEGKVRTVAALRHGLLNPPRHGPYFFRLPSGPYIAEAVFRTPDQGRTGVDVAVNVDEGRFAVHGVTLGKVVLSRLRQPAHPVFLRKMNLSACCLFQCFHAGIGLFQGPRHGFRRRRLHAGAPALFPQDVEADLMHMIATCAAIDAYAALRTERCRKMDVKTSCDECEHHCYAPEKRDEIRTVMRYAGPRMLGKHPIAALRHLLGR